ncbi:MAG: hypothetical protein R2747_04465 [Pyrinomonadaceae bacterium]
MVLLIGCAGCSSTPETNQAQANSPSPEASVSPSGKENTNKAEEPNKPESGEIQVPGEEKLQELVKGTLLEFNNALEQEDFTDFHQTISQAWQKEITPEELNEAFSELIDKQVNISAIRSLEAKFSEKPKITNINNFQVLSVDGNYPTEPLKTNFKLEYVLEEGSWKLSRIEVFFN